MSRKKQLDLIPKDDDLDKVDIINSDDDDDRLNYAMSLVIQGKYQFFTLTIPSDVLARTCFVASREDDPELGFQRKLDEKRAQNIAEYIDSGMGTIPTSIVLSAQPEADFQKTGRGKTVSFRDHPHAFLILDGQHRVYGFRKARTKLRVPVVIYSGLTRVDESRLFIDINTNQKPVPPELLLDIRRLAEYQGDVETLSGQVFDLFNEQDDSPLLGMMSATAKKSGKISRVTFNASLKPLLTFFPDKPAEDIYVPIANYIRAYIAATEKNKLPNAITEPIVLRGILMLFPDVAERVQYKHGKSYTTNNFFEILFPAFKSLTAQSIKKPGKSAAVFYDVLRKCLKSNFSI